MSGIRGFLIDLDGVMYTGDLPIPGAAAAIEFLDKNGYSYRFVSNTTRKCRRTITRNLAHLGLAIPETQIFTPPVAAVAYMKATGKTASRFLVTGDARGEFPDTPPMQAHADLVIVGDAGNEITYNTLNTAFRDLMNGAELIALEKDRYWMAPEGLSLSAGPFIAALEYATGKTAVIMGKPSKAFFELALQDMGLRPDQVIMIGDDIRTDIGGAQNAGMRGVLVRTGKFCRNDISESQIRPDLIISSIADITTIVSTADQDLWER
ncbi:MAG: TIGR01458 family HAD-type hydrolase [Methanomicrobiales archaeon]|nr:TIGR01458 family HAD-type hydrolase [Methanomicrobiales archaeon]